jgi:spore photoproduct lyase
MRRHLKDGVTIATNTGAILTAINNHAFSEVMQPTVKKPNQTDAKFITYDISCNEDYALHSKFHDWKQTFEFFRTHPVAKATLATKYIPKRFLSFNPEKKVRIRFSMMPQKLSSILEPGTTKILDRIKAVNTFIKAGYEIHLNFSPVIVYDGWKDDYKVLFKLVNEHIKDEYKPEVLAEVIFLTHNVGMHMFNLEAHPETEKLLWAPSIQEAKTSEYGGRNVRYKAYLKRQYIEEFKTLHNKEIPWNKIRYIF